MSEPKLVLVIDDEPDTLAYFKTVLQDNGYRVVTAENGDEGLRLVSETKPDLITLDVSMPEMSGVKFYREMREKAQGKSIPIVIITGVSGDFEKFISSRRQVPPPDGYLSKPVDANSLLEAIAKLV